MTNSHLLRVSLVNSCLESKKNQNRDVQIVQLIVAEYVAGFQGWETNAGGGRRPTCFVPRENESEPKSAGAEQKEGSPNPVAFIVQNDDLSETDCTDRCFDSGKIPHEDEHRFRRDGICAGNGIHLGC